MRKMETISSAYPIPATPQTSKKKTPTFTPVSYTHLILTDREHTPATIAARMLEYGYSHYTLYIGEHQMCIRDRLYSVEDCEKVIGIRTAEQPEKKEDIVYVGHGNQLPLSLIRILNG